jgi:hypothetical protein
MSFFARFAPGRAYRDLRVFLAQRQPYELWFLLAAMAVTGGAIALLARNDIPVEYKPPEIIYVKQWNLDRTEAEILAQQKIDQAAKDKDDAELKRQQAERRAMFKRMGDTMDKYGLH